MKYYLFSVNRAVSMIDVVGLTMARSNQSNKTQSSLAKMLVVCSSPAAVCFLMFMLGSINWQILAERILGNIACFILLAYLIIWQSVTGLIRPPYFSYMGLTADNVSLISEYLFFLLPCMSPRLEQGDISCCLTRTTLDPAGCP